MLRCDGAHLFPPSFTSASDMSRQRVAVVLAEEWYECLELHYPRLRLIEEGFVVHVVGPQAGQTYKASDMSRQRVAVVLAEEWYECLELHYPRLRLIEEGFVVHVVGPQAGQTYKSKEGYWAKSTATVGDVDPNLVDILVVPGGFCPDRLRRYPEILSFVSSCWNEGNGAAVGFICHGAWVPISARIVKGTCRD
ncbi:peptidase, putative [Bodo saltans]|uniref:Peptidase, putative n=1 Tax=Bodo saltans TaxID=75058 RepID=A0A0S4IPP1_BODSA|nr:peptidase, putative [Bodo saltans]|eukprot:CUF07785.1 peptidase, putative [Bodo saltans]